MARSVLSESVPSAHAAIKAISAAKPIARRSRAALRWPSHFRNVRRSRIHFRSSH